MTDKIDYSDKTTALEQIADLDKATLVHYAKLDWADAQRARKQGEPIPATPFHDELTRRNEVRNSTKKSDKKGARTPARTDIRYFHDGRSMPESHRHKLSTVAYFYSKDLVGSAPRCSTKDFVAALKKAGIADPTQPGWMVELPNGITIECRVDGEKSEFAGTAPAARKAPGVKKATAAKKTPAKKATPKKQTPGAKARAAAKPGTRMVTPLPKKSAAKRAGSRTPAPARKSA